MAFLALAEEALEWRMAVSIEGRRAISTRRLKVESDSYGRGSRGFCSVRETCKRVQTRIGRLVVVAHLSLVVSLALLLVPPALAVSIVLFPDRTRVQDTASCDQVI